MCRLYPSFCYEGLIKSRRFTDALRFQDVCIIQELKSFDGFFVKAIVFLNFKNGGLFSKRNA